MINKNKAISKANVWESLSFLFPIPFLFYVMKWEIRGFFFSLSPLLHYYMSSVFAKRQTALSLSLSLSR